MNDPFQAPAPWMHGGEQSGQPVVSYHYAGESVRVGGGFTPGQLVGTGVVSFAIAKVLGASVPGAIVMGFGNMLWEAGSGGIPAGWRRYVLGLFRKPE